MKHLYGVKILLKTEVENNSDETVLCEELVVTVKAKSSRKAKKKAKKYVKGYCVPYKNCYGDQVTTEIDKIFRPFKSDCPAEKGVREVYSRSYYACK